MERVGAFKGVKGRGKENVPALLPPFTSVSDALVDFQRPKHNNTEAEGGTPSGKEVLSRLPVSLCWEPWTRKSVGVLDLSPWKDYLRTADCFLMANYLDDHLVEINFSGCNVLSSRSLRALLQNCFNLKVVILNDLLPDLDSALKDLAGRNKSLEYLSVKGPSLNGRILCQAFAKCCKSLRFIDFSHNAKVSDTDIGTIVGACHALEGVNLTATQQVGMNAMEQLAVAPKLKKLILRQCYTVDDECLRALFHGNPSLLSLDLSECPITDVGILTMIENKSMTGTKRRRGCRNLRYLSLQRCSALTDISLSYISLACPNLTAIDLSYCVGFREKGLEALGTLSHLRSLICRGCSQLRDKALFSFLQSRTSRAGTELQAGATPSLQALDISECHQISGQGILKVSQCCPSLKSLNTQSCKSLSGPALSIAVGQFQDLKHLRLQANGLAGPAIQTLVSQCRFLEALCLYGWGGHEKVLRKLKHLKSLRSLALSYSTSLSDATLRKLPLNLMELNIEGCQQVTSSGLFDVLVCSKQLKALNISYCVNVDEQFLEMLQAKEAPISGYVSSIHLARFRFAPMLEYLNCFGCPRISYSALLNVAAARDVMGFTLVLSKDEECICETIGRKKEVGEGVVFYQTESLSGVPLSVCTDSMLGNLSKKKYPNHKFYGVFEDDWRRDSVVPEEFSWTEPVLPSVLEEKEEIEGPSKWSNEKSCLQKTTTPFRGLLISEESFLITRRHLFLSNFQLRELCAAKLQKWVRTRRVRWFIFTVLKARAKQKYEAAKTIQKVVKGKLVRTAYQRRLRVVKFIALRATFKFFLIKERIRWRKAIKHDTRLWYRKVLQVLQAFAIASKSQRGEVSIVAEGLKASAHYRLKIQKKCFRGFRDYWLRFSSEKVFLRRATQFYQMQLLRKVCIVWNHLKEKRKATRQLRQKLLLTVLPLEWRNETQGDNVRNMCIVKGNKKWKQASMKALQSIHQQSRENRRRAIKTFWWRNSRRIGLPSFRYWEALVRWKQRARRLKSTGMRVADQIRKRRGLKSLRRYLTERKRHRVFMATSKTFALKTSGKRAFTAWKRYYIKRRRMQELKRVADSHARHLLLRNTMKSYLKRLDEEVLFRMNIEMAEQHFWWAFRRKYFHGIQRSLRNEEKSLSQLFNFCRKVALQNHYFAWKRNLQLVDNEIMAAYTAYKKRVSAANMVQAWWRGTLDRRRALAWLTLRIVAATKLQAIWRRRCAWKILIKKMRERRLAEYKIREKEIYALAAEDVLAMRVRRYRQAANKVGMVYKQYRMRMFFMFRIQAKRREKGSHWNSEQQRKKLEYLEQQREDGPFQIRRKRAALKIQAYWRGLKGRRLFELALQARRENIMATRLQAAYRGRSARRAIAGMMRCQNTEERVNNRRRREAGLLRLMGSKSRAKQEKTRGLLASVGLHLDRSTLSFTDLIKEIRADYREWKMRTVTKLRKWLVFGPNEDVRRKRRERIEQEKIDMLNPKYSRGDAVRIVIPGHEYSGETGVILKLAPSTEGGGQLYMKMDVDGRCISCPMKFGGSSVEPPSLSVIKVPYLGITPIDPDLVRRSKDILEELVALERLQKTRNSAAKKIQQRYRVYKSNENLKRRTARELRKRQQAQELMYRRLRKLRLDYVQVGSLLATFGVSRNRIPWTKLRQFHFVPLTLRRKLMVRSIRRQQRREVRRLLRAREAWSREQLVLWKTWAMAGGAGMDSNVESVEAYTHGAGVKGAGAGKRRKLHRKNSLISTNSETSSQEDSLVEEEGFHEEFSKLQEAAPLLNTTQALSLRRSPSTKESKSKPLTLTMKDSGLSSPPLRPIYQISSDSGEDEDPVPSKATLHTREPRFIQLKHSSRQDLHQQPGMQNAEVPAASKSNAVAVGAEEENTDRCQPVGPEQGKRFTEYDAHSQEFGGFETDDMSLQALGYESDGTSSCSSIEDLERRSSLEQYRHDVKSEDFPEQNGEEISTDRVLREGLDATPGCFSSSTKRPLLVTFKHRSSRNVFLHRVAKKMVYKFREKIANSIQQRANQQAILAGRPCKPSVAAVKVGGHWWTRTEAEKRTWGKTWHFQDMKNSPHVRGDGVAAVHGIWAEPRKLDGYQRSVFVKTKDIPDHPHGPAFVQFIGPHAPRPPSSATDSIIGDTTHLNRQSSQKFHARKELEYYGEEHNQGKQLPPPYGDWPFGFTAEKKTQVPDESLHISEPFSTIPFVLGTNALLYDQIHGRMVHGRIRGDVNCWFNDGSRYVGPYVHDYMDVLKPVLEAVKSGSEVPTRVMKVIRGDPSTKDRRYETRDMFRTPKEEIRSGIDIGSGRRREAFHWGVFITPDRWTFSGVSVDNHFDPFLATGYFVLQSPDNHIYCGQLLRGRPHGFGRLLFPNGTQYEGEWVWGKKHGRGMLWQPEGFSISGNFSHDLPHGHCSEEDELEGTKYVGSFRYGWRHGFGVFVSPARGIRYLGQFSRGKPHGLGICSYIDGNVYKGEWIQGVRHGHGILYTPGGIRYDGPWENGRQDGLGVISRAEEREPQEHKNVQAYLATAWKNHQKYFQRILRSSRSRHESKDRAATSVDEWAKVDFFADAEAWSTAQLPGAREPSDVEEEPDTDDDGASEVGPVLEGHLDSLIRLSKDGYRGARRNEWRQRARFRDGQQEELLEFVANEPATKEFLRTFPIEETDPLVWRGPAAAGVAINLPQFPHGVDEDNPQVKAVMAKILSYNPRVAGSDGIQAAYQDITTFLGQVKMAKRRTVKYERTMRKHAATLMKLEEQLQGSKDGLYPIQRKLDEVNTNIEAFWKRDVNKTRQRYADAVIGLQSVPEAEWQQFRSQLEPFRLKAMHTIIELLALYNGCPNVWKDVRIFLSDSKLNASLGYGPASKREFVCRLADAVEHNVWDPVKYAQTSLPEKVERFMNDPKVTPENLDFSAIGLAVPKIIAWMRAAYRYMLRARKILPAYREQASIENTLRAEKERIRVTKIKIIAERRELENSQVSCKEVAIGSKPKVKTRM